MNNSNRPNIFGVKICGFYWLCCSLIHYEPFSYHLTEVENLFFRCEWLIYILTKLLQNISLGDGDLHRPLFSLIDFRSAWVWNFPSLIWSNPCEAIFFLNLKVKWDYSSLTLMIISSISRKCFFCFPCMIGHDFYCLLGIVCDREFNS